MAMQRKRSGRRAVTQKELKEKAKKWDNHPNKPFPAEGSYLNKHKFEAHRKKMRIIANKS
jgi:hypothetical protein